ncbi:MAG: delta-60 repeat domain-containing protein [Acidobacteria bacterium]|nr:delta-60 repeat domain-containing protein [Acidobacteriota bacterium]
MSVEVQSQIPDPGFRTTFGGTSNQSANVTRRADGKLVYFGTYRSVGSVRRDFIAMVNTDGSVDTDFDAGEIKTTVSQATPSVNLAVSQADSKLLIAGSFTHINGNPVGKIVRLNIDGSIDPTFNIGSGPDNSVTGIKVLSDGKILVSGYFGHFNGFTTAPLIRLNPDGTLDQSFSAVINGFWTDSFTVQTDGKIIAVGDIYRISNGQFQGIVRLNSNGSIDSSFDPGTGPNNYISTLLLQPDGKILISGSFSSFSGSVRRGIGRLNTNGSLDTGFVAEASTVGGIYVAVGLSLQSDGRVIIGGSFDFVNGTSRKRLARLGTDGTLDPSFVPEFAEDNSTTRSARVVFVFPDDTMLIGGTFYQVNQVSRSGMAKLGANGATDTSYSLTVKELGFVYTLAGQADGKIVVGGSFSRTHGIPQFGVTRLNQDGSVDQSFNAMGSGIFDATNGSYSVSSVAIQSDGKISDRRQLQQIQ